MTQSIFILKRFKNQPTLVCDLRVFYRFNIDITVRCHLRAANLSIRRLSDLSASYPEETRGRRQVSKPLFKFTVRGDYSQQRSGCFCATGTKVCVSYLLRNSPCVRG